MSQSETGMPTALRAPKGVAEYVGEAAAEFIAVRDALLRQAALAGYGQLELPVFEDTALYVRGVGESTDVVGKEMFTFTDRGGRSLTLRPEGTAGAIRAIIEHGMDRGPLPAKVSYAGPFFRAERPQHGRYRQFTQVGIEAVGSDDPALDAEVIDIAHAGYRSLGLQQFRLLLNSLGCHACRPGYRAALLAYWQAVDLDGPTRERAKLNPLRVLDDKRPELQSAIAAAPLPIDHLCTGCRDHLDAVKENLAALGVGWEAAPRLVRGLDYYTRTTFEFSHDLLGAQSGIGGGGRYDGLMAQLGGQDIGGVGFGLGVDRTLLACRAEGLAVPVPPACQVFGIALGAATSTAVVRMLGQLRRAGVSTDMAFDGRSMRAAMKAADRSGARYAIIVGERDLAAGIATVRDLSGGEQRELPLDQVVPALIDDVTGEFMTTTEGHQ